MVQGGPFGQFSGSFLQDYWCFPVGRCCAGVHLHPAPAIPSSSEAVSGDEGRICPTQCGAVTGHTAKPTVPKHPGMVLPEGQTEEQPLRLWLGSFGMGHPRLPSCTFCPSPPESLALSLPFSGA